MNEPGDEEPVRFGWPRVVVVWCCSGVCCFWVPLVCFLAASNVSTQTCEQPIATWIRVYGILAVAISPVTLCLLVLLSKVGMLLCVRLGKVTQGLSFFSQGLFVVYGFAIWSHSTQEKCYRGSGIDPMKLMLVFMIIGMVAWGCTCLAIMRALPKICRGCRSWPGHHVTTVPAAAQPATRQVGLAGAVAVPDLESGSAAPMYLAAMRLDEAASGASLWRSRDSASASNSAEAAPLDVDGGGPHRGSAARPPPANARPLRTPLAGASSPSPTPASAPSRHTQNDATATAAPEGSVEAALCVVCFDGHCHTAIAPCGHMNVCDICLARVRTSRLPLCPACRGPISSVLRIYS